MESNNKKCIGISDTLLFYVQLKTGLNWYCFIAENICFVSIIH